MSKPQYSECLGRHSYMGDNVKVIGHGESKHVLRIGNFCSIAENVTFYLYADHQKKYVSTFPFKEKGWGDAAPANKTSKGDIIVGNDVWIGRNASIMSGVKIGDSAIIAADAVVTKCVMPYEIVGGNPARNIGWRLNLELSHLPILKIEEVKRRLRDIGWWDWPDEKIRTDLLPYLDKPEEFIARHYPGTQPTPTR